MNLETDTPLPQNTETPILTLRTARVGFDSPEYRERILQVKRNVAHMEAHAITDPIVRQHAYRRANTLTLED